MSPRAGAAVRGLDKVSAPGRRHFLGHGGGALDRLLATFPARVLPEVSSEIVRDASLAPLLRTGKGLFTGGVFAGGAAVPAALLHRGFGAGRQARITALEPPARAEHHLASAVFGGTLFDHYGHFLLEGFSRVLAPEVAAHPGPILLFNPMRLAACRGFMRAAFAHAGVDPERVVLVDAATAVDRLLVPAAGFEIRGIVRPQRYAALRARAAARAGAAGARAGVLYLTRSGLGPRQRVAGEARLEAVLRADPEVTVLAPETLAFEEQLAAIERAALVVGCEGSALHGLAFAAGPTRMLCLSDGVPNVNYLLCDELFAGDSIYADAAAAGGGDDDRGWTLDVDKALSALVFARTAG